MSKEKSSRRRARLVMNTTEGWARRKTSMSRFSSGLSPPGTGAREDTGTSTMSFADPSDSVDRFSRPADSPRPVAKPTANTSRTSRMYRDFMSRLLRVSRSGTRLELPHHGLQPEQPPAQLLHLLVERLATGGGHRRLVREGRMQLDQN